MSEYIVDHLVAVVVRVLAFDDADVVSIDHDMWGCRKGVRNGMDEEFKADGFGSSDVSFGSLDLPVWEELPGLPLIANDDVNANTRASI